MSLINKLLQDLEQRQVAAGQSEPDSAHVRSVLAPPKPKAALIGGMVFFAVAAIAGAWIFLQDKPVKPVIVAAPVVVPTRIAAATAPAPAVATVVVAAPAPKPAVAPVVAAAVALAPVVAAAKTPEAAPVMMPKPEPMQPVAPRAVTTAASPPAAPAAVPEPRKPALQVRQLAAAETKVVAPVPGVVKKPSTATDAEVQDTAEKPAAKLVAAVPDSRSQKTVSPQQLSDNLYKQAVVLMQQGNSKEARPILRKSLEAGPGNNAARQMLVGLLVESNSVAEANALLREGLKLAPEQSSFWMSLARLQLENADANGATVTLEQGLPSASDNAQYHAFYAALMQRAGRHDEAVRHYLTALRSDPSMPTWLVGIGISLQAAGRENDATEAFQRAKDGGQLPAALVAFVDQRLSQLKR